MSRRRAARRRTGATLLTMAALTALLVVNVLPLAWGVLTSLKQSNDILSYPPALMFAPVLEHYVRVMQEGFGHNLLVSLLNTIAAVLLTLLVGVPAAYGFVRARFALRRPLYLLVVACIPLALGASALIIPAYVWFTRLGIIDTVFVLPLIYAGYQIPMAIWVIKNAIEVVPVELDEAATIDGCGHFGILWRVILPLARPGIGAAAILAFVGAWNEFLAGSVMVNAAGLKPVQPAIYAFVGFFGREWGPLTAAATLAILPIVVAFVLFGRLIISGLTSGGVKG
jgi:multiple sugar transport system permease protein